MATPVPVEPFRGDGGEVVPPPLPVVESGVEPAAGPPAPPAARFCNACGAAWEAHWDGFCQHCVDRQARIQQRPAALPVQNTPINSAIALYFAFLGASVVMMIAMLAGANGVTVDFVVSGLVSLMIAAWCVVRWRDVAPALGRTGGVVWYPVAVGAAVGTFVIASIALFVLGKVLGVPQLRLSDDFLHQGYGMGTVILMVAVQPAIFEELAFRGVILQGLQHVLSPVESIFVSALMFMIIHLAVPSFPHLFVIGLALGWLRVRTGSLYPGMVLHFTHNLLCVVFEVWSVPLPW